MDVKIKKRNKEEYMKELVVYISDCFGASEYIEDRIEDVKNIIGGKDGWQDIEIPQLVYEIQTTINI